MTTLLYTHPVFSRHEVPPGHVEHGGRDDAVDKALQHGAFAAGLNSLAAQLARS